jgi:phage gp45-like
MMTLTQEDKEWIQAQLASAIQYGKVTRSNSNGDDAMDGWVQQIPSRRMGPWGLRALPPVGSECVGIGAGGSQANLLLMAAETTSRTANGLEYSYGPKDLKEGETALYDKAGSVLRQSQDGTTKVDAASGKDISLTGGTHKVARVGDRAKVTIRSVYTVVSMVPPVYMLTVSAVSGLTSTILFQFTGAGAVSIPTAPGVPYDVEVDSEIFEGAPHVTA